MSITIYMHYFPTSCLVGNIHMWLEVKSVYYNGCKNNILYIRLYREKK